MTTNAELLADVRDMLRVVRPTLDCYIVDMDLLRGHTTDDGSCLGWAHIAPYFDLGIRDRMGDAYEGPKAMFALDLQAIREVSKPGNLNRCVRNVGLHEACHCDERCVLEPPDVFPAREFQAAAFATGWKESTKDDSSSAGGGGHDQGFVRRCAHLYHRAITAGYDVAPDWLFGMRGMGWQSSTDKYIASLGSEVTDMANATFDVIEAIKPPAAFSDLWADDVARYQHWENKQ